MVPLRLASRPQMTSSTARIAPPSTDAKNRILKSVLERLAADWIALAEQAADRQRGSLPYATKKIIARSANRHTKRTFLGVYIGSGIRLQASVAERPIALSCHGSGKTRFLIGSPGTVRLATGTGRLSPIEKTSIAVSPPRRHKPACRPEGCGIPRGPAARVATLEGLKAIQAP
jgi:hypothetical protein